MVELQATDSSTLTLASGSISASASTAVGALTSGQRVSPTSDSPLSSSAAALAAGSLSAFGRSLSTDNLSSTSSFAGHLKLDDFKEGSGQLTMEQANRLIEVIIPAKVLGLSSAHALIILKVRESLKEKLIKLEKEEDEKDSSDENDLRKQKIQIAIQFLSEDAEIDKALIITKYKIKATLLCIDERVNKADRAKTTAEAERIQELMGRLNFIRKIERENTLSQSAKFDKGVKSAASTTAILAQGGLSVTTTAISGAIDKARLWWKGDR